MLRPKRKSTNQTVQEFLGLPNETPVLLATSDKPIQVTRADSTAAAKVKGRNDPRYCVVGQCFTRLTGLVGAFYQRFSYIPEARDGKLVVVKYQNSATVGRLVHEFDAVGKHFKPFILTLKAIPPSWRPDARRRYVEMGKARRKAGIPPRPKKKPDPSLRTMRFRIGLKAA